MISSAHESIMYRRKITLSKALLCESDVPSATASMVGALRSCLQHNHDELQQQQRSASSKSNGLKFLSVSKQVDRMHSWYVTGNTGR